MKVYNIPSDLYIFFIFVGKLRLYLKFFEILKINIAFSRLSQILMFGFTWALSESQGKRVTF